MFKVSNLRVTAEQNHLFVPASKTNEIIWVLKNAGVDMNNVAIKQWRKVLKNHVPEIKHVTESSRNAEIDKLYGDNAKYVKTTPSVIISHYNTEDLFEELHDTLMGEGDADYIAYFEERQSRLRSDEVAEAVGIQVMTKDK